MWIPESSAKDAEVSHTNDTVHCVDEYERDIQAHRQSLIEGFRTTSSEKDKIVVSTSGAALGVSVAFLRDILASEPPDLWLWVLRGAWACFAVALILVLLTLDWNPRQIRRSIDNIDFWKADNSDIRDASPEDGGYRFTLRGRRIWTVDLLNTGSVYFLVAGIVLFVFFLAANI